MQQFKNKLVPRIIVCATLLACVAFSQSANGLNWQTTGMYLFLTL